MSARSIQGTADGTPVGTITPSGSGPSSVTNRSGAIATGGVSEEAAAANTSRTWLYLQNPSTETEPLFIGFGETADTDGSDIELAAGQIFVMSGEAAPTTTINVNAATTAHKFIVKEA